MIRKYTIRKICLLYDKGRIEPFYNGWVGGEVLIKSVNTRITVLKDLMRKREVGKGLMRKREVRKA